MIETLIKPENEIFANRMRITRTMYKSLFNSGLLEGRCELIDGVIISKMPIKPPHRIALIYLRNWLQLVFGAEFIQTKNPIEIPGEAGEFTEPEPDIVVTREPTGAYLASNPGAQDVLLVVEVADSTLRSDLATKALLYARVGIPEYLVLDVAGRQIYRHRQPTHDGYLEIVILSENEDLTLLNRSETIAVSSLLPLPPVPSA